MASTIKVNNFQSQCGSCGTITIGGSGDTVTLGAGASQSGFGRTGTVDWDTTAKTTSFTAVSGNGYFVNTTSGAITVTLPAGSAGSIVSLKDYANTWDTNNVTVTPNGTDKINGTNSSAILNTEDQSVTLVYVDSTKGWRVVQDSTSAVDGAQFVTATGGTITTCGNFKIHTFTSPGTFCVSCAGNAAGSTTVDYLVVAGGGGSAASGCGGSGGGGGGGYRESSGAASGCYTRSPLGACVSALPVSVTGYPITVGAGGTAGPTSPPGDGAQGSNSIFSTVTSAGGGTSKRSPTGGSGGSGGGGSPAPLSGGAGNTPPVSPPQGQPGGTGLRYGPGPSTRGYAGGGGGGATATGASAVSDSNAGSGGNGATSCITGSPVARAGGGGGGSGKEPSGPTVPAGTGGTGGGGNGGQNAASGSAGTANTGGGAGGSGYNNGTCYAGAAGGSGIVIIRYKYQ